MIIFGLYYLVRSMPLWQAAIVTVVYIPRMSFIMLFVMATVPTGFHIAI